MTPTVNTILTVIAIVLQIAVLAMYSNAHLKWPLFDPLDYWLLRRKLPKLFRVELMCYEEETRETGGQVHYHETRERPATIFEKAEWIKKQLLPKLVSAFWRKKMTEAIDDYAEKLSLDEEYSDGAISAIVSHIQNTHKPNV